MKGRSVWCVQSSFLSRWIVCGAVFSPKSCGKKKNTNNKQQTTSNHKTTINKHNKQQTATPSCLKDLQLISLICAIRFSTRLSRFQTRRSNLADFHGCKSGVHTQSMPSWSGYESDLPSSPYQKLLSWMTVTVCGPQDWSVPLSWIVVTVATVVMSTVILRMLEQRKKSHKQALAPGRTVMTQSMTTYRTDLATPQFQFLQNTMDHGAWVAQEQV